MISIKRLFGNMPIRRKMVVITMLTSCLALVIACSVFLLHETYGYRDHLAEELNTVAGIVGDNCASALSFDDPAAAEKALESLSNMTSISGAAIYDEEGGLFAMYKRSPTGAFNPPAVEHNTREFTSE